MAKTCTKCARELPEEDFHRDIRRGNRRPSCRACDYAVRLARYEADPAKRQAALDAVRAWYIDNKESHVAKVDAARKARRAGA